MSLAHSEMPEQKMNERIVEYQILHAYTEADLGKSVNEAISDGWELSGGVAVTQFEFSHNLYQAMFRCGAVEDDGPELESGRVD